MLRLLNEQLQKTGQSPLDRVVEGQPHTLKVMLGLSKSQDLPPVQQGALLLPTQEALAEGQTRTWTWPWKAVVSRDP